MTHDCRQIGKQVALRKTVEANMVRLWEAANEKVYERQRKLQETRNGGSHDRGGARQREAT